jgi:OOP family OmpA-OmpF porin
MSAQFRLVAAVALSIAVSGPALSQSGYKAQDIVNTFAPDLGATRSLGAARGLCIGTEAECSVGEAKPATKATFDLLVNFDYDSDVLTPEARRNLDEFAAALRDPRLAASSFLVEGHTDATGSPAYNLSLSERRANAVVRYLEGKGIDTSKLVARGLGQTKPRTANPFDAVNRRVETRLRAE